MLAVSQKLNTELPHDPAILLLNIYSKELKVRTQNRCFYIYVHNSITQKSQKVELTQVSFNR